MAGVKDYSTTPDSNTTINSINIAEGCPPSSINNAIRQAMADIRAEVATKGTNIASAASIDLGAATGDFVDVTGTITITALGTVSAGIRRTVRFTGALTLTHNATSLILPGGANITTANGDIARFRSLGSGNWVCERYSRADGEPVFSGYAKLAAANEFTSNQTAPSFTAKATSDSDNPEIFVRDEDGNLIAAVLFQRSDNTFRIRNVFTSAEDIILHADGGVVIGGTTGGSPGADSINAAAYQQNGQDIAGATAWVNFNGTGTVAIRDSFNVSSVTDNGTGDYTVNFSTAMANTSYSVANMVGQEGSPGPIFSDFFAAPSLSGFRVRTATNAPAASDALRACYVVFGGI